MGRVIAAILLASVCTIALANAGHFQIGNHIFAIRDEGGQSPMVEEPAFIPFFNASYVVRLEFVFLSCMAR